MVAKDFGDVVANESGEESEVAALQQLALILRHLVAFVERSGEDAEDGAHHGQEHLLQEGSDPLLYAGKRKGENLTV